MMMTSYRWRSGGPGHACAAGCPDDGLRIDVHDTIPRPRRCTCSSWAANGVLGGHAREVQLLDACGACNSESRCSLEAAPAPRPRPAAHAISRSRPYRMVTGSSARRVWTDRGPSAALRRSLARLLALACNCSSLCTAERARARPATNIHSRANAVQPNGCAANESCGL